jgi:phage shock protein PspC (stress-responsive transcriptional regulator)
VPRGVDCGLAYGAHRLDHARAGRRVTTDHHELDRDAVELLDLGTDVFEHRSYGAGAPIAIRVVEPRPQLPLLAPGERRCASGIAAGALDERERLEDGVVEVRSNARTLLRADALPPLGGEVAYEPRDRGGRDEGQASHDRGSEQGGVAGGGQIDVERDQPRDSDPGENEAQRDPRSRVPPGDQCLHAEAVPGDQQAQADEDERQRDRGIETEPEPLDEEQEPHGHERGRKDAVRRAETFLGHATASPSAGPQHERPGSDIEDDPEPARRSERYEGGPHDGRRHPDPAGDPGSDSGKEPVLRVEGRDPVENAGMRGGGHDLIIPANPIKDPRGLPWDDPDGLGERLRELPMAIRQPERNDRDMSETTTSQMPTGGAVPGPRRLVRTPDGKIAGVAAGIGHYVGVDPTVVRIAFILLAFVGGIGILLYGVGWLVMPKGEISTLRDAGTTVDSWTIGALAALVVGVGLLFGWHGFDDGFQVVAGLALIGGGIWLLVRDRPPREPSVPATTPPSPPPSAPPEGADPVRSADETASTVETHGAEGAEPAAPSSRRGAITAGVVSLLSIGAALVIAGSLSGWFDASASVVLAAALVVVGAGLVLASVVGRARWLFVVGIVLTCALLTAAAVEPLIDDGVGEKTVAPATLVQLQSRYEHGIGDFTVDLRNVALDGKTRRVEVELGIGSLTVLVPKARSLVVDAHVDAGKLLLPDGRTANGWDESLRYARGAAGKGALVIDLEMGFGDAQVRRG